MLNAPNLGQLGPLKPAAQTTSNYGVRLGEPQQENFDPYAANIGESGASPRSPYHTGTPRQSPYQAPGSPSSGFR